MQLIDAERLKSAILERFVPMPNRSISQYDRGRAEAQDEILDLINALSNGTDNSSAGGTWIPIGIYQNRRIYQCSECGRKIIASKSDPIKHYPYCHCGAKMGLQGTNE